MVAALAAGGLWYLAVHGVPEDLKDEVRRKETVRRVKDKASAPGREVCGASVGGWVSVGLSACAACTGIGARHGGLCAGEFSAGDAGSQWHVAQPQALSAANCYLQPPSLACSVVQCKPQRRTPPCPPPTPGAQVNEKVEEVVGTVQDAAATVKERASNAGHVAKHTATAAVDRAASNLEGQSARKRWVGGAGGVHRVGTARKP